MNRSSLNKTMKMTRFWSTIKSD